MSIASEISQHLPFLRRFARALTGTQTGGDAYVAAVLEAIAADRSLFPRDVDPRVALYRTFVSLWQSIDVNVKDLPGSGTLQSGADENLQNMAARPRQAFLLTAVEGFSDEQAATILDTDVDGVHELLDTAARQMGEHVATDVMIIEDEPLIALDIESLVQEMGHEVTGIARTRDEAVALFAKRRPGLILSDIQLADGSSGIDAVNDILQSHSLPIIFITAFPEQLLTGNRPEPAFLVTKPFEPQMVRALVSQALFFKQNATSADAA
jgi:CheY-like chemotaxis protein